MLRFTTLWKANAIAFISSFCVMVIELVASRILAPHIGMSLYTWTSIIGVILTGISLGNYLGGKIADRYPYHLVLVALLFFGSLLTVAILPVTGLIASIGMLDNLPPMLDFTLKTFFIFFFPAIILSMISPMLIKLTLADLGRTGGIVGTIYAFSTAGAIFGTFMTGFYLILWLGIRMIVCLVAFILLLTGILTLFFWKLPDKESISMKKKIFVSVLFILFALLFIFPGSIVFAQESTNGKHLDERVRTFLNNRQGTWEDMNVPESDGEILYNLIIKNKYKKALEIGTSTGHSAIWIAWAISKTGGKLITIEIDEERHLEALANFKEAGLSDYIDARLADAHILVKTLTGPFDFVFCDADKEWYKNYFVDIYPKLEVGGCYTAHNVSARSWGRRRRSGSAEFYDYVINMPDMETTVDDSGNGMSISYKKSTRQSAPNP